MCYFKEKCAYILFILLFLALFITNPQFVYSQIGETDPPYIVQTYPEDGDTDVPVNSSIEVLFNEFMDDLFNPFSIVPGINGSIEWGELDPTLIFSPAVLFNYNTTYQVTIGTQATDLSGNSLENDYIWSFDTELLPWQHIKNILGSSLGPNNYVKLILGDNNGDIWVVLSSEGFPDDELYLFNGFDADDFFKFTESFGQINAIAQDSAGDVWVASGSDDPSKGGIHVFDGMDWTHYNSTTNTIFSDTIMSLTIDSEDKVWAGSDSGIYMFNGSSWTNYNTSDGLSNDWVTNIKAAEDDSIWVTTLFGGIEVFDQQSDTWTNYTATIENQLNINSPLVIEIVSGPGKIWVATNLGLLKCNIATVQWERFTQIDGYLLETHLNSIAQDSTNDLLWLGTDEGLIAFDGVNVDYIILGDAGPQVLEIAIDAYGNKWIGTNNSLSRYDTISPLLLSFSPSNKKKNVSQDTKIVLTFSEPMDVDSVIDALSISPSISYTSSVNSSSTKLTIKPKSKLKDNKKYTVTVGKAATDIQKRPLTKDYSSSFTTKKKKTTGTYTYTSGTFPVFPTTAFPTFPTAAFPTTAFPTFPASRFPTTAFPTFPTSRFPTTAFPTFPTSRFPTTAFPATFPNIFSTSWTFTASPFRSIGQLAYPYR